MQEKKDLFGRVAFFNLMRFVGAICIAVFLHYNDHFLPYLGLQNPYNYNTVVWALSHDSVVFVEMYFIISGILFVFAYKDKVMNNVGFDTFFARRIIRIYPLVVITSIFMYTGNFILYKYNGTMWSCGTLNILELFYDMLFGGKMAFWAGNTLNGSIWYVNTLLICYVLAYILTRLYKKSRSVFLYALPVFFGVMIQYSGKAFGLWNEGMARGYIAFFIGVMMGLFFESHPDFFSDDPRVRRRIRLAAGVELAAAMGLRLSPIRDIMTGNIQSYFAFLVFPSVILLGYDCGWINRLCAMKPIAWLGNISYGIYLWDFPVYFTLHLLIVSGKLHIDVLSGKFLVLSAVIHILVAGISYRFLEMPISKKLNGLMNKSGDAQRVPEAEQARC